MGINDLIYGLGDVFYATFELIEIAENAPNILFIAIIVICLASWVFQLIKHEKTSTT